MRKSVMTAAVTSAALLAVGASLPANATGGSARGVAAPFKVVAQGLHGPRGITFSGNDMYVAEAGTGGAGPCIPGAQSPVCFGLTGSVTRVRAGKQWRVLKGLPSLSDQGSQDEPIGPADLRVVGSRTLVLSMGLGSAPKNRKDLPKAAQKQLGHLLAIDLRTKKSVSLGDLAKHEARTNPVNEPNSDPTGLVKAGRGWLVTDSGGNDLLGVKSGKVGTVATFHNRMGVSPVTGPSPVPYESVPTDVVKGPDGAYYVSELTGFPFIVGASRIWRVVPGLPATVWATGLTNVTSLTFDRNKLYAVQLADNGLLNGPIGSLNQVFPDSSGRATKTIASGLFAPYGVAIHHGSAYVSIGSVGATGGAVIKVPLG
jgi:hypothetical protein